MNRTCAAALRIVRELCDLLAGRKKESNAAFHVRSIRHAAA
jgi:hypothetical protein